MNRVVGIEGNDELSAELFGGTEIADMTDMEEIEATVGECDLLTTSAPAFDLTL